MKIQGWKMFASNMNESQVLSELDVQVVDTDLAVDAVMETEFHSCELRVLCARGLALKASVGGAGGAAAGGGGGGSTAVKAGMNPFVIVSFNEEEIGRTGIVSNSSSPEWQEEVFDIRAPSGDELETCVLQIEVFDMGMFGKGALLGRVDITGKNLSTLLASTKYKRQWFDLWPAPGPKELEQCFSRGQIKLGGRPMSAHITGEEDDAVDLGELELTLIAASNFLVQEKGSFKPLKRESRAQTMRKSSVAFARSQVGGFSAQVYATVVFNGVYIHRTTPAASQHDLIWEDEKAVFTHPCNKALSDCELRIELYSTDALSGMAGDKYLGTTVLTGPLLLKCLGGIGCSTAWYKLDTTSLDAKRLAVRASELEPTEESTAEIKLRGGPLGAKDIFSDEGGEIWLDVLAASSLRKHKHKKGSTEKFNPYVVVVWNGRVVGESSVLKQTVDPIWDKQRFILRVPKDEDDHVMTSVCSLRVEVSNATPECGW